MYIAQKLMSVTGGCSEPPSSPSSPRGLPPPYTATGRERKMDLKERVSAIEIAEVRMKAATEDFIYAVKAHFPVGSVVDIKIGKAVVAIEITGHNDLWWSDPGRIRGVNVNTGKQREFGYSQILVD